MSGWHIFWIVVGVIWGAGCIALGIAAYLAPSDEDLWGGDPERPW